MSLATPAILAVFGLILLVWSADRFIAGSGATARLLGMPPLLIGMLIIGFGTSAPELIVSIFSALQGNPSLALGNAYGSNIVNIALILGLAALINPIRVNSRVLRMELPILSGVTLLSIWLLRDAVLHKADAVLLLGVMVLVTAWSHWQGMRQKADSFGSEVDVELKQQHLSPGQAVFWLVAGLLLLLASSRLLVWAAVEIASSLGVTDLVIGLTVVAIGTSLPELASTIVASRKGEHDLAVGNIIGSNLFNTMAVVGMVGIISPFGIEPAMLGRDIPVMTGLTLMLFLIGWAFRGPGRGRVNRFEGLLLLSIYIAYTVWLVTDSMR